MGKKAYTNDFFVKKCEEKHSSRFDYSKANYINKNTPIFVSCKKHGEFEVLPRNHLTSENGGCRYCINISNGHRHRKNNDHFIKKAIKIHGDKYDYSSVRYKHSLGHVDIICPEHGKFSMRASNHINNGQGCPLCANERVAKKTRIGLAEFSKRVKNKKNNGNYDFSEIREFTSLRQNVDVFCNKHGKYKSTIANILNSAFFGCKKCKIEECTYDTKQFIELSKKQHGDKYLYDDALYTKSHNEVKITCPTHGDFVIKAYIHLSGGGHCPKCTSFVSSYEIEILEYLKSIGVEDLENRVRRLSNISEIDILSETDKIGIEFNGIYWHSDIFKDNYFHYNKTIEVNKLGYRLIQIFEDEWVFKCDIVKSILKNAFKKIDDRIFARKCNIVEVDHKRAKKFLEKNHIQGFCVSKYRFGLEFNGELVSLMTFGRKRRNMGNITPKDDEYELLRFCNKLNYIVVGGASKLFNHFVNSLNPEKIISFCDMRYGVGGLYNKLGFSEKYLTKPNYFYIKSGQRYNRFAFRKDVLVKRGFSKDKTEREIMREDGYRRLYDCGSKKYEWKRKDIVE